MTGLKEHLAASLSRRMRLGAMTVVLSAAVLLAGGCGTPATNSDSNVGTGTTAKAATATEGGVPNTSESASSHAANTRTKVGLLIWVPSGWRVMTDSPGYFVLVPKEYADTFGEVDPAGGMIALQVLATTGNINETPAEEAYKADKSAASSAKSTSWLGLTGLSYSTVVTGSSGDVSMTVICVGGGGGRQFLSALSMSPTPIAKYQAEADAILAAMKRAQ